MIKIEVIYEQEIDIEVPNEIKTNQQIGIEMQEKVALIIEKLIPEYKIVSNGTRGADLYITSPDGVYIEGEVKSAQELFVHTWNDKKNNIIRSNIRRGIFNVLPHQINHDFFAFAIRFMDIINGKCIDNGDFEVFYADGRDVKKYLKTQTLNCMNYKLHIDKLPKINAKMDFLNVFDNLEV